MHPLRRIHSSNRPRHDLAGSGSRILDWRSRAPCRCHRRPSRDWRTICSHGRRSRRIERHRPDNSCRGGYPSGRKPFPTFRRRPKLGCLIISEEKCFCTVLIVGTRFRDKARKAAEEVITAMRSVASLIAVEIPVFLLGHLLNQPGRLQTIYPAG